MTVHLPLIGVTLCERAYSLLTEYPENIVGSFWVMCGYGFEDEDIPDWWINLVVQENQAKAILDAEEEGCFRGQHSNPLWLGFCIIVVANPENPAELSYFIQHLRMSNSEGIRLLKVMAEKNIPAHTEVTYPSYFLSDRYGEVHPSYQYLRKNLMHWTVQIWEDYCCYLMADHGQGMLACYYRKTNEIKDEVKATIDRGSKPLVLTEGETDPIYIKTALELLGEKEILEKVDIEWVGTSIEKGKSINTGDSGLNNTRDVLLSNPKFLTRKVLLLYDCDTKRNDEDNENLKIRRIPQQQNRKISKGIENLFPDILFTANFYTTKTRKGSYGETNQIQEFQKMQFCKWICEQRRDVEDFRDFEVIVNFIKDCLGSFTY
jgi:hypothetical protein